VGFITRRSGLALAGAFTIFLPVFGNFALSMFFLAGLGMLRVGWLPFWDISFQVLDMGNVVFIPYWVIEWILRQFDIWAQAEIGWVFMGIGAFLFTWGVLVWMQVRFQRKGVASSLIYKISRHPQYLGWIIWSYGLIIYSPLVNQMKKSWGMASSLPWLLMTMIIVGICMLEEMKMRERYGKDYNEYQKQTPFLFPLPWWLKKMISFPMWLLIRKPWPESKREIALVISTYTFILIALSLFWVDLGEGRTFPLMESRRKAKVEVLVHEINIIEARRYKWFKFNDLAEYGDLAVQPMIDYLGSDDPEKQEFASALLGGLGDTSAIVPLRALLDHPWENVRVGAIHSLVKLNDEHIIPELVHMLDSETADYPRSVIFEALGNLHAENTLNILEKAATEETEWVRVAALRSLCKIHPDRAAPYLLPLLSSESARVRGDAVAIAYQLADPITLPALEDLLDDEHYEIRFFAKEAIDKIGEQ
jgi:protein-S-isoprenylcysteine O-methyltransferase Ste14